MRANLSNRPSIDRVREVVAYDPETGILTWKITSGRAIAGREAGGVDKSTGYHRVGIDGMLLLSHHVAWAIMMGVWPEQVDHRYGKEAGNGWANLRLSTQQQNMANKGKTRFNKSGFKGVSFHKDSGKWMVSVGKKYIGIFDTPEQGAVAYEEAAIVMYGEFARGVDFKKTSIPVSKLERRAGRPTVDEIRDALSYDPITGEIRWKKSLGFRGKIGDLAGRKNTDGYWRVGLFGKQYPGHVIAWVWMTGEWPTLKIDHKNNIRDDNRWENLREATQSQNIANAISSGRNKSGYRGVSYMATSGAWGAWIKVNGKSRFLGRFASKESAHQAYCIEARKAFGEFAKV